MADLIRHLLSALWFQYTCVADILLVQFSWFRSGRRDGLPSWLQVAVAQWKWAVHWSEGSVVWSPVVAACMSKCSWAIHWTPNYNCSCEWVNCWVVVISSSTVKENAVVRITKQRNSCLWDNWWRSKWNGCAGGERVLLWRTANTW